MATFTTQSKSGVSDGTPGIGEPFGPWLWFTYATGIVPISWSHVSKASDASFTNSSRSGYGQYLADADVFPATLQYPALFDGTGPIWNHVTKN